MTEENKKTYNQVLVDNLKKVKQNREDIHKSSIPDMETSEVVIPIPNVLIEDKDKPTVQFVQNIGKLKRKPEFHLEVQIKKGQKVTLTDGRQTNLLELIFGVNGKTDIGKIESFLEENSEN